MSVSIKKFFRSSNADSDEASIVMPSKRCRIMVEEHHEWHVEDGLMYCNYGSKPCERIAAFDMDNTLIKTKSGKIHPIDENDWVLFDTKIPRLLQKLSFNPEEPFRIVIFSNQLKAGKDTIKATQLQKKVDALQIVLGVPLLACLATADDIYRKPCIGMWNRLCSDFSSGISIDMGRSFFVGDAAGRAARSCGRKKDFSAADIRFALNIGLIDNFHTPESMFKGESAENALVRLIDNDDDKDFDPRELKSRINVGLDQKECAQILFENTFDKKFELCKDAQEILILVGAPGAGKSSVSRIIAEASECFSHPIRYVRVSSDDLGGKPKAAKFLETALKHGKSAIIDCLNTKVEHRQDWCRIAANCGVKKSRVLFIEAPKQAAMHLQVVRCIFPLKEEIELRKTLHVPRMVLNIFFKDLQIPTVETDGDVYYSHWNSRPFFARCEQHKNLLTSFLTS